MTNPVARLVRSSLYTPAGEGPYIGSQVFTWCPACAEVHPFTIESVGDQLNHGITWAWDGNLEKPTFNPSLKVEGSSKLCHSYLKEGVWQFLTDCTHHLAGMSVEMVPLPDWLVPDSSE